MLELLNSRRTVKVIGDAAHPIKTGVVDQGVLQGMLASAGNAPFHHACEREHQQDMSSPVPWRTYSVSSEGCRQLMKRLMDAGDTTKVPNMLAAASHLFQVTWLPDIGTKRRKPVSKEDAAFDGTLRNMEHIAAASAFSQSLLISAEASGYRTYWSSGGPLRGEQVFEWLGIPDTQILLGAIFLFPKVIEGAEIKPGALAEKRGGVADWCRHVEIG